MKCPVCKNQLPEKPQKCAVCGFSRFNVEFLNVEGATNWVEMVVLPYREQWKKKTSEQQNFNDAKYSTHTGNNYADISDFEYKFDEKGVVLTKYLKYGFKSVVHIPETIAGKNVYYLDKNLFKDCKEIETVLIPTTVQIIGDFVFQNTGIKEIKLPPYLKVIGQFAFSGTEIKEIFIPYGVSYIGEHAFSRTNITSISFPEKVIDIQSCVCSDCRNLKSVKIHGATKLSTFAFSGSQQIEELLLPETLKQIYAKTSFEQSLKLKSSAILILPKSLESVHFTKTLPAKIVVAKNDAMKWDTSDVSSLGSNFGLYDNLFNPFNTSGANKSEYIIYCNPGSTSHNLARQYGFSVRPLSSFVDQV